MDARKGELMTKKMQSVLLVFTILFLTSCGYHGMVLLKPTPGADKTYSVTDSGTVEILGQDMKTEPTHWIYVDCEHWSGCFMRCQGKIQSCKNVATGSNLTVDHIMSRAGS